MSDSSALAERYGSALQGYLHGSDEDALQEAYEVGRQALDAGFGPLVLFSIHRDVMAKLAPQPISPIELVSKVTTVFTEALAPFEMAYASFDEARVAVKELSTMLEDHAEVIERVRARLDRLQQTTGVRRRLLADVVAAQEEERRRIAGEIHDDAVQTMAVVQLRIGMLRHELPEARDLAAVDQLEASVGEAISRLRRLIAGLVPPELEESGLARAVQSLVERIQSESDIDGHVADQLESEPRSEVSAVAFRIVQEALANARKHARASRIDVVLESRDNGVLARVIDDGIGFEADAALRQQRPGHLGLPAVRERVELAGGWLNIESDEGGTSVGFWLPGGKRP